MATSTKEGGRVGLDEHGVKPVRPSTGTRRRRCSTSTRSRAARRGSPRAARSSSTPAAHRPLAEGQVRRARARLRGPDLVGRRQRRAPGGALRAAARQGRRAPRRAATSTSSTRSPAPTPRTASRVRVVTDHPYHALFAQTMFIEPTDDELATFEPQALVLHAPALEADPDEDGTRTGTFVVLHPSRTEVLIGGTFYAGEIKKSIFTRHERPPAARGRLPDALLGERRRRRRRRDLLRPLRHRQDDALRRSRARADRRRRARLGRRRRLQLRGRLLREGDPPLGRGRARDLRDDAHVRDDPRERRRRRARRRSTSTTTRRPRTRARPTSSSRSRTRCRRSAPATRARSSCSPPTRSGSCRRSRG